jgi:uncharacterized membrane protein YfcA
LFDLGYYLVVSFCILLFAISKSGFSGGGLALISVTVLSITYGPLTAIAILMPMLIVCDAIAVFLNRKYYDHSAVWSIAPFSLLGVIAGTVLFKFINLSSISVFIGSISLAYVIFNYLLTKSKIKKIPFYGSKTIWGTLAGFTSFVLHSGGLPMNIYFMSIYNRKVNFVAGLVFSMALINLFKLIPYFYLEIVSFKSLIEYLVFSPVAVIGVILGHWMNNKLSDKSFFAIINFFIVVASIRLIYLGFIEL